MQRAVTLPEDNSAPAFDASRLIRGLPALVKGYLRLGATFSPAPAIDPLFDTIDLFVVLPLFAVELAIFTTSMWRQWPKVRVTVEAFPIKRASAARRIDTFLGMAIPRRIWALRFAGLSSRFKR